MTAAGSEAAVLEALLAWFAGMRGEADELHLSGSLLRLPEPTLAAHRLLCSAAAMPSYSVELGLLAAGDGALDPVLSANARQQLRRAFAAFRGAGSARPERSRYRGRGAELVRRNEGVALRLMGAARHGARVYRDGFFEPFHRRLIERNFAEGAIQLLEIRAGERIIGYLYNFRRNGRVYAYQSGFADADPRERPGFVTHALAIRHAFRAGLRCLRFHGRP